MPKDVTALKTVTEKAKALEDAREQLQIEADAWVQKQLVSIEREFEESVIDALDEGHAVAATARALTLSGKTPNRNKVYEIRAKYANSTKRWVGEYPFEWEPRTVKTAKGETIIYDLRVVLNDFGPDSVTGEFRWRYDVASDTLEEIFEFDSTGEPYPSTTKYYKQVLDRWLAINPYPGGE